MKNIYQIIVIVILIIIFSLLIFDIMKSNYGCISPVTNVTRFYNISDYSCDKLKLSIEVNAELYRNEVHYICDKKIVEAHTYYQIIDSRNEFERRCLN